MIAGSRLGAGLSRVILGAINDIDEEAKMFEESLSLFREINDLFGLTLGAARTSHFCRLALRLRRKFPDS